MTSHNVSFEFTAIPEQLSAARNCIRGFLQAQGWAAMEMDVNIAAGEIMQNIIRYGFEGGDSEGRFEIEMTIDGSALSLIFRDTAPPSDPTNWNAAHRTAEEGGHGLVMVRAIAEVVEFEMLEAGNQARLVFRKPN